MTTKSWISSSRRIYGWLIRMYPREYRDAYGAAMIQLHTDQCRDAARRGRLAGVLGLWVKTLCDLAASLLREHFRSPDTGLLEAVPGRPLSWKGVTLVLVPCLVFLVGQIGQLTGQDWFYVLLLRAGFFMMIPVFLVCVLKRKFPVWGLIPLGIFFHTIRGVLENFERYLAKDGGQAMVPVLDFNIHHYPEVRVGIVLGLLALVVTTAFLIARRQKLDRRIQLWGGAFLLLLLPAMINGVYYFQWNWQYYDSMGAGSEYVALFGLRDMVSMSYFQVVYVLGYLLLILLGAFLAHQHGRLALLLPLGYLIPFVLVGRFDGNTASAEFLLWSSVAVAAYRFVVTVVAPVWIVRSGSENEQGRAGAVAFSAAVVVVFLAQVGMFVDIALRNPGNLLGLDLPAVYYSFAPLLTVSTGLGLAIALYRRIPAIGSVENPIPESILVR